MAALKRLFDWTHPDKKRIYYFSEGSAEDKSKILINSTIS